MASFWKTVRSWAAIGGPQVLHNPRLLHEAATVAEDLRPEKDVALILNCEADAANRIADVLGRFIVAAERTLNYTPFDVQLLAAAAMAQRQAVEMQTGEGKTLATAAAATILASQGRRVHVATVNRYLAQRDFDKFAPVLRRLGISVGLIHDGQSHDSKCQAYTNQVVYGTGYEFGFDYLREQLARMREQAPKLGERFRPRSGSAPSLLRLPLDCILVDELDSVLLDEACVPLILSEPRRLEADESPLLALAEEAAESLFARGQVAVDSLRRTLHISTTAYKLIDHGLPRGRGLQLRRPWRQYVEHAATALRLFQRDVHYLVADQKIWIIDETTGRIFVDRRWPEGLQQAIEFKERIPFSQATVSAARLSRQRFFKLYRSLAGTSGTLMEAADELRRTYGGKISIVRPRLPSQRQEWQARYFVDNRVRLSAAAAEAANLIQNGRPILVGCRNISASRETAACFAAVGIPHRILDGTQTADEAQIIAEAGRSGCVTIATNLAGRGTDILLDEGAHRAGGLHVIGIERHDSPRIDRQLLGRAGRQGEPGSGRFFISADDALLQGLPSAVAAFRNHAHVGGEIDHDLGPIVAECQTAHEAESRLRRREVADAEARLDDLSAVLAKSE